MILREYQNDVVSSALEALNKNGDGLGVMSVGGGKTVCMSEVMRKHGGKIASMVHLMEISAQNYRTFKRVAPRVKTGIFNADIKAWGDVTFCSTQTLGVPSNLAKMPKLDLLVIDEAAHVVSPTQLRIIDAVKEKNPDAHILGFTATPARSDKIGLRKVFSNVFCNVSMTRLIKMGFLVPPKTYVCALPGTKERLKNLKKMRDGEVDLAEAGLILDCKVLGDTIVKEWKKLAGNRQTIFFCSTVQQSQDMAEKLRECGISAAAVFGDMSKSDRARVIQDYDRGKIQCLCGCLLLTEGVDLPTTSAIVFLRPSSFHSVLIQCVGRGLRTVDPERYPWAPPKRDCIVLDMGLSLSIWKSLDASVSIENGQVLCKGCGAMIDCTLVTCPLCGHERGQEVGQRIVRTGLDGEEQEEIVEDIEVIEYDVLKNSCFKYVDVFNSGRVMISASFDGFVAVCSTDGDTWSALAKQKGDRMKKLLVGDKGNCLAIADDWLRGITGDISVVKKTKRWLTQPASDKQVALLQQVGYSQPEALSFSKYAAVAALQFSFNRREIEGMILR